MLNINMEFRRGILFIRLSGDLTKKTVNQLKTEVTDLIKDNGIRNIVFNMNNLNKIDLAGISNLYYNYEISQNNHGKSLICGVKNSIVKDRITKSRLMHYMCEISDELSAFKVIDNH